MSLRPRARAARSGAAAIATALESNHRLRTLEMRLNRVGDAGAASFAALMPKNVPLSTLDLISNGITDTGDGQPASLPASPSLPHS